MRTSTNQLRKSFGKFDGNGDGHLDDKEIESLIGAFKKLSEGDGKLTPETLREEAKEQAREIQMNKLARQVASSEATPAGIQHMQSLMSSLVMQMAAVTISQSGVENGASAVGVHMQDFIRDPSFAGNVLSASSIWMPC